MEVLETILERLETILHPQKMKTYPKAGQNGSQEDPGARCSIDFGPFLDTCLNMFGVWDRVRQIFAETSKFDDSTTLLNVFWRSGALKIHPKSIRNGTEIKLKIMLGSEMTFWRSWRPSWGTWRPPYTPKKQKQTHKPAQNGGQ